MPAVLEHTLREPHPPNQTVVTSGHDAAIVEVDGCGDTVADGGQHTAAEHGNVSRLAHADAPPDGRAGSPVDTSINRWPTYGTAGRIQHDARAFTRVWTWRPGRQPGDCSIEKLSPSAENVLFTRQEGHRTSTDDPGGVHMSVPHEQTAAPGFSQ